MILSPLVLPIILATAFGDFSVGVPQAYREAVKDAMVSAAVHGYWRRDIGISLDSCKRSLRDALDKQDKFVK